MLESLVKRCGVLYTISSDNAISGVSPYLSPYRAWRISSVQSRLAGDGTLIETCPWLLAACTDCVWQNCGEKMAGRRVWRQCCCGGNLVLENGGNKIRRYFGESKSTAHSPITTKTTLTMTAAADDEYGASFRPVEEEHNSNDNDDEPPTKRSCHDNTKSNDFNKVILYAPPLEDDNEHLHSNSSNIRTSSLSEPTMKLSGHKGSVYCLSYDPQGELLCSGSFDSTVLLWKASGNCENIAVLTGHKNAILDVTFTNDSEKIITASADYNLGVYDSYNGERIKRFMGHKGIVNAVDVCREG